MPSTTHAKKGRLLVFSKYRKALKRLSFISLSTVFLCACSTRHHEMNELASSLSHTDPEVVLSQLTQSEPPERDLVQHELGVGTLQFLVGDFNKAVKHLEDAKKLMAELEATSISETATSATINETLSSYSGTPTDKVMVHNLLALSYLMMNNLEAARVEVLQADVIMKKLADTDSLAGQLASAHLISGIIFELLGENDNAYISYKLAESILEQRGLQLGKGLKLALLRQSNIVGVNEQHEQYLEKFSELEFSKNTNSQVFMLYLDGVISSKQQASVAAIDPSNAHILNIAMPSYPKQHYSSSRATLSNGLNSNTANIIEDLETIVRQDLDDDYPRILALTTARAIAKHATAQVANEADTLIGILVNIAAVLSESADLRSWNVLPSNIQFGYIESDSNEILVSAQKLNSYKVPLTTNSQNLVIVSSLSKRVFTYSQPINK